MEAHMIPITDGLSCSTKAGFIPQIAPLSDRKKPWDVIGKCDEAERKSVNPVSQNILHNFRTGLKTSYQPDSDAGFRNQTEAPFFSRIDAHGSQEN